MSQNNPASWTNNEWKFSYEIPEQESGLPGQLSPVGDRQQSPLDMLGSFGEALFTGIFDTLGDIFNGIVEVGGSLVGGLVEGVKSLIGWVGSTIASLLSGGTPRVPPPPIYSEIRTDLEGDLKPFVDAFKESQEKAFQAVADAEALRELFDENQKIVSDRIDDAEEKIQQVGDVDAKISAEAGRILAEVETHRLATEKALGKAETASEDLAAYKLVADAKIQSALADAKAGLDKLEVLEPRVSGVISDLEAYEEATNSKIRDLLGVAGGAVSEAERALESYDELLADYEPFKTDAAEKLAALNALTGQQQETINGAVTGSVMEYAVGTSETTAPTTGWSTSTPTRTPGSFVWMRSQITYGSGTTKVTSPVLVTGNTGAQGVPGATGGKGATGATGATGSKGADGISISSVTSYYRMVTKGASAPAKPTTPNPPSGWSATEPNWVAKRDLYRAERVTYSNGTFSWSDVSKVASFTAADKGIEDAEAATLKAENALSELHDSAGYGVSLIGGSLANPSMPAWTTVEEARIDAHTLPAGATGPVVGNSKTEKYTSIIPDRAEIPVNSGLQYRVSFWVYSTNNDTALFMRSVDQNGNHAVEKQDVVKGLPAPWVHAVSVAGIPGGEWVYCERLLTFKKEVKTIRLIHIGWNEYGTPGWQHLSGLEIVPVIPTQGQVDDAQNKAIRSHQALFEGQHEWNEVATAAINSQAKINDDQDGLIALNNKIGSANTAALRGHQDILDMAFPNTNLVPTTDGVPVWTTIMASNPVRTEEGVWRFNSKTAVQTSSSTKHVPTLDGVVYRATVRLRRTTAETQFSIRLREAGGTSNASLSEVTDQTPLPGATRKSFPTATHQITAPLGEWETWYYDFKLANGTGDVRVGYVLAAWGIEVDQLSIVALLPSQHEVNALNHEINSAQNEILHDHQRALDLMYPADNVIPRDPAGLNVGTEAKPQYVEFPYWLKNGIYSIRPAGSLPAGNRLSAMVSTSNTPNTRGPVASVTAGVDYNYEFYFKATAANSGLVIYLVDQNGSIGPGEWNVADGGYSTSRAHLWWNGNMPGGTGPETGGFYRMSGKIRFKPGVTGISIERIFYNWASSAVTTAQELTGIRIWPDIPSQQQVDEAQNTAIGGNKKSIDALERTVRLSFPHINTLPYSGGNPLWQTRASWISRTTAAANLPPMGQRTEPFSSLINGTGTMTRNAASSVDIPDDVTELRIRGLLRSNGGFFPIVDLHNDAGVSIISSWRRTFPTDDEVSLSGKSEIWYGGSSAGGYSVDGNNTDPWQPFDIVVQVKSGSKNFHIKLSSTSLIAVHGLAVFSYYPSQSEVDFAQDRAMRALSGSVDLAASIGTAAATAAKNLGIAQTAMQMSLVTTASYIPRVMIINDLGHRSAHERSEHVQVRKDGSTTFLIDARGSSWTGLIVVTTFYGSSMVTDTFDITPGGSRTNGVLKRRSNSDAQHMRIDYWVNPEVETKEVSLGGTDVPHNKWVELANTSFTATGFVPDEGPALPVLHIAEITVGWDRATNHAKYGVRIKLAGTVVATLEETRVGPRYPWGEPYANQVVSWSGQVMPNQKITFEVLSNDTVPSQRRLRDAKRLVSYSKGV